jgi:hypothetical protein
MALELMVLELAQVLAAIGVARLVPAARRVGRCG